MTELDLYDILPEPLVGCNVHQLSYYDRLIIRTISPIAAMAVAMLMNLVVPRLMRAWQVLYISLFLSYCVLANTSLSLFRFFDCTKFVSGQSYLTSDMSLECDSSPTRVYMTFFACLMIAVWPVGVPLVYFFLVSRPSTMDHIRRSYKAMSEGKVVVVSDRMRALGFLYMSYSPRHPYSECGYKPEAISRCTTHTARLPPLPSALCPPPFATS